MSRIIPLEKAINVRELGGYPTIDGKTVKPRRLIRSASIYEISANDKQTLLHYGLSQVIDFRSYDEVSKEPDKQIPGVENTFLPIFPEDETMASVDKKELLQKLRNVEDAEEQMKKVYRLFVESEHTRKQYRQFLTMLLEVADEEKATLFHCTAGKDRTGFGAFLILSILGVDEKLIKTDYLATNQFVDLLLANQAKQAPELPENIQAAIRTLMLAKESYLEESLAAIQTNYGSVAQFVSEGLGFTENDQKTFKALYTY